MTHILLPNQFAGADDIVQVTQPSSRRSSMKILVVVLFCFVSFRSVVEPSWDDRGSSIWGCLSLFGSVVGHDCIVDDVCYIYVLCEVAIVSQLFIPFLFSTWGV